jgi:amyloid beta A4 precursor protein-binding family B member 1
MTSVTKRQHASSHPTNAKNDDNRFVVKSLGWKKLSKDDIIPENLSKTITRCIKKLSSGRNTVRGRWSVVSTLSGHPTDDLQQGKDLLMELDDDVLKIIDPNNAIVLNSQNIRSIRSWGTGGDEHR